MKTLTYEKNEIIFRQGSWGFTLYDIRSGEVGLYVDYGMPSQKELTVLLPGQSFGEMGMLQQMARSATAVALQKTALQEVRKEEFHTWLEKSPKKVMHIMQQLGDRTRELTGDYQTAWRTMTVLSSLLENEENCDTWIGTAPVCFPGGEPERSERVQTKPGRETFHAGDVIFRQGDPGPCMYSIFWGTVGS